MTNIAITGFDVRGITFRDPGYDYNSDEFAYSKKILGYRTRISKRTRIYHRGVLMGTTFVGETVAVTMLHRYYDNKETGWYRLHQNWNLAWFGPSPVRQ